MLSDATKQLWDCGVDSSCYLRVLANMSLYLTNLFKMLLTNIFMFWLFSLESDSDF